MHQVPNLPPNLLPRRASGSRWAASQWRQCWPLANNSLRNLRSKAMRHHNNPQNPKRLEVSLQGVAMISIQSANLLIYIYIYWQLNDSCDRIVSECFAFIRHQNSIVWKRPLQINKVNRCWCGELLLPGILAPNHQQSCLSQWQFHANCSAITANDARVGAFMVSAVTDTLDLLLKSRNSRWQKVNCLMGCFSNCASTMVSVRLAKPARSGSVVPFPQLWSPGSSAAWVHCGASTKLDKNNGKLAIEMFGDFLTMLQVFKVVWLETSRTMKCMALMHIWM